MKSIYSPVFGFVDKISVTEKFYIIYIYITRKSNHKIYIPVTGTLQIYNIKNGIIKDPIFSSSEQLFKQSIDTRHTAEITWSINNNDETIYFTIQVGKPKFITDSIKIYNKKTNFWYERELLGEILLGSRAIVCVPINYTLSEQLLYFEKHTRNKSAEDMEDIHTISGTDDLVGGKTMLAYLTK